MLNHNPKVSKKWQNLVSQYFSKSLTIFAFLLLIMIQNINAQTIYGEVLGLDKLPLSDAVLVLRGPKEYQTACDQKGKFAFEKIHAGTYTLIAFAFGYDVFTQKVTLSASSSDTVQIVLNTLAKNLDVIEIQAERERTFGITKLKSVEQFGIYEAKKTEVIILADQITNTATNNTRQAYAKVVGLNIWESDGAGLQLGIGGRGLSPNRSSNFNLRQNGYDISADALGYPESYYTPPLEAIERIEIVRGAASLQYGTQFGGLVNFKFRQADSSNLLEINTRQSAGSWGFFSSFNSLAISKKKFNLYTFYQRKQGKGWRPNSAFEVNTAYLQAAYKGDKWQWNFEYTHMNYLAQQAGGLTDRMFQEDARQSVRPRNWFEIDWNLFSFAATHQFNENTQLNIRNFGIYANRSSLGNLERINVSDGLARNRTLIAGDFQNFGNETRLLHRYGANHVLLGVRLYSGYSTALQGDADNGSAPNFRFINPNNLEGSNYQFPNSNLSVFAEHIFRFGAAWSLTPGIRYEFIQTTANGQYRQRVFDFAGNVIVDNTIAESLNRKRNFVIAGLGLSFKPKENKEFYANASQNYRAINFTDLRVVNPNFQIDSNLTDEKGYTADLGFRGKLTPWLKADGGFFMIAYQNKIGQILRADQAPLFLDYRLRTNIATALSWGFEALLEFNISKLFKQETGMHSYYFFSNIALTDARYLKSIEPGIEGNNVEMVPPVILRSGFQTKFKNWTVALQHALVTKHFSDASNASRTATAVEGIIPTYQIFDLSIQCKLKNFNLEGTINNVLNAQYFTRRAEAYPGPGIIPADGRGFYFTLGYRFAQNN